VYQAEEEKDFPKLGSSPIMNKEYKSDEERIGKDPVGSRPRGVDRSRPCAPRSKRKKPQPPPEASRGRKETVTLRSGTPREHLLIAKDLKKKTGWAMSNTRRRMEARYNWRGEKSLLEKLIGTRPSATIYIGLDRGHSKLRERNQKRLRRGVPRLVQNGARKRRLRVLQNE